MKIPALVIGFDYTNRKSHVWCSIIVVGGKQPCLIKQNDNDDERKIMTRC